MLLAANLNRDDTSFKVLAPGRTGKTKKGYPWTYVCDGRSWGARLSPLCSTLRRDLCVPIWWC